MVASEASFGGASTSVKRHVAATDTQPKRKKGRGKGKAKPEVENQVFEDATSTERQLRPGEDMCTCCLETSTVVVNHYRHRLRVLTLRDLTLRVLTLKALDLNRF